MNLIVLGINHKKAPLEIREKFSFREDALAHHYRDLTKGPDIDEVFILSTCNRVEIYCVGVEMGRTSKRLKKFLYDIHGISPNFFKQYFYVKKSVNALRHLYRVASGLDSMMIGEPQILGQIKKAYESASSVGVIGPRLHQVIQDSLRVGKKVRSSTGISRGVTSISGVVVELIKKELKGKDKKILVIGAGKIGAMTAVKLADISKHEIVVTNRDMARAGKLSRKHNLRVTEFSRLPQEISAADIVIATTTAPHLIHRGLIESILKTRQAELIFIDLGVPRNIDDAVRAVPGVRLFNIDDLAPAIEQTIRNREIEARKAEQIIQKEMALTRREPAFKKVEAYVCDLSFSA